MSKSPSFNNVGVKSFFHLNYDLCTMALKKITAKTALKKGKVKPAAKSKKPAAIAKKPLKKVAASAKKPLAKVLDGCINDGRQGRFFQKASQEFSQGMTAPDLASPANQT